MKSLRFRSLLIATAFAAPALAYAHPGHDGDHDFVWDFGHLVSNPLATIAGVSLLAAAAWGVRRLVQSRPARKAERVKRN
jgi:hydrogenase/urease accessory protein HupE